MTATPGALHTVPGAGPAGTSVALELARRWHAVRLVDRSGPVSRRPASSGSARAKD
ncbi:hypothetical protein [Streptomyces chrestomyceticus]|uniref:hypothetical protein n=1 Tax=Streptomyces chrestomyceticus TaxID=68185 RepID=UPI0037A5500C